MAQIRVDAAEFSLYSGYSCITVLNEDSPGNILDRYATSATAAQNNVEFVFELSAGSRVNGATINATVGSPSMGYSAEVLTINGVDVSHGETVSIPVEITDDMTSVTIPFIYKIKNTLHDHGVVEETKHGQSVNFTDVYLLIETQDGTYLYHAEDGTLVPYQLYHAENSTLVLYRFFSKPGDKLHTADGEQLYTADGYTVRVLGE